MDKKSSVVQFIKQKKNIIYLVLISVSALIIIAALATELKKNYFYVIGDPFDVPEMLVDETTAAQFGTKTLNKQEYSFMYYSCLYSLYPELKSKKFIQISNYINSTEYSEGQSIAQAVQIMTEESIVKMYSYLQDAEDRGIKIDASNEIEGYMLSITQEAEALGLTTDEYLSIYYGSDSSVEQVSAIIADYQSYKLYEQSVLKDEASDITEEEYEELYLKNKDAFDCYNLSFLMYEFGEEEIGNEERQKEIKEALSKLYENVHKREDFSKLGKEFCDKHSEDAGSTLLADEDTFIDYYSVYMINPDVLEWAADSSRKKDSVAMFEYPNGYMVVYFNGRERDERETYNGLVVSADRKIEFVDGTVPQPTLYTSADKSPYYQIINDLYSDVSGLKDVDRTSYNIIDLAAKIDTNKYSKDEDIELNTVLLENSLLEDTMQNSAVVSEWVARCKNGDMTIVEDAPYYSLLYISSKGLPCYKANIVNMQYRDACTNIETSYSPMFSNINYSNN